MREANAQPRRRLLLCSQGVPHSSRGASSIIFWNYIATLRQLDFQILNVLLIEQGSFSQEEFREYEAQVSEPGRFEVVPFWSDAFLGPGRLALKLKDNPALPAREQAAGFRPEVIVGLDLLPAWMMQPIEARKRIIWLGDLNFDTAWYHAWYGARENPLGYLKLPLAWWKSRSWEKIYREVLAPADLVLVASKSSEERLARLGITAKYLPYPWPENSVASPEAGPPATRPTFLFFGSLVGLGSRSAFHFLLRDLYPQLVSLWGKGGFQILVGGRTDMPSWMRRAIADKPEISYLGYIEDLGRMFATCHAVIAPIEVPVGNRSRILTAMAQGALVIAHVNAALGNPDLKHGENCLLASDAVGFAREMQRAVAQPEKNREIRNQARQMYVSRFSPEVANQRFMAEIKAVLNFP